MGRKCPEIREKLQKRRAVLRGRFLLKGYCLKNGADVADSLSSLRRLFGGLRFAGRLRACRSSAASLRFFSSMDTASAATASTNVNMKPQCTPFVNAMRRPRRLRPGPCPAS